ncbi:MAG: hypothetical protein ABSC06_33740 [Rhodopila sp.]|jgi:hypothetical protein
MSAPKGTVPPNAGKGRPKGSRNKVTADIRALAQQWGPDALKGLAVMAGLAKVTGQSAAESEAVRKSAMDSILDRAYGRSTQPMEHSVDEGLESILDRLGRG